MMRKMSTVFLVNFGTSRHGEASTVQINGMVLVLLLFHGAQEFANPYTLAWCNRVTFAWTITCILVLGSALLFQTTELTWVQQDGFSALLILACICSTIVSAICFWIEKKNASQLKAFAPGTSRLDREKEERRVLTGVCGEETGMALFRKARGLTPKCRNEFIEKISLGSGASPQVKEVELTEGQ